MKIQILSHNWTGHSLVMAFAQDGVFKTKIVEETHPNWNQVIALYKAGNYEAVIPMLDMSQAINAKFHGKFTVKDGKVFYEGNEVGGYLVERIVFFMRELPNQADRLIKFAENLYYNPSPYVIEQLYKFLEHKNMPITEDGCFLAYKGIGVDFFSKTGGDIKVLKGRVNDSGQIYNGAGEQIEVERSEVCSDKDVGCSKGLHVGSWEYANDFKGDGHLMVVKVNPKDAVSVPLDCSCKKLRTCAYEVLWEEGRQLSDVKDINFDKVVEARKKFNRDSLGRFSKFCRDANGRFAPKV